MAPQLGLFIKFGLFALLLVKTLFFLSLGAAAMESRLSVETSLKGLSYLDKLDDSVAQNQQILRMNVNYSLRGDSPVRLRLRPELQLDPSNKSQEEKFFVDYPEAHLELRASPVLVQAGMNTFAWGITDVFNPVDVVNPRRYYDPLNSEKRGVPSVLLKLDPGVLVFEAVYIPQQLPSQLPGENSRWLPREVSIARGATPVQIILPQQLQYYYIPHQDLDNSFKHNFGGRLSYQGSGWDGSLIYFEGSPTAPTIQPVLTGSALNVGDKIVALDSQVGLRPLYNRRSTAGATASTTLGDWIFRLAYAYSAPQLTQRATLPGWAHESCFSVEHGTSVGAQTLTLLAQYTFSQHEEQGDNSVTSLNRIFDRSYFLGARLTLPQDWTLNSGVLYDSVFSGSYAQVRIEKKLRDALTMDLTGELLDGSAGTPLGTYRKNDRVGLRLNLFF